eukprot:TRINITY_DN27246_c0_g1_i1.p1 TRINITY_DN27246_c0_g1~~TRINITY_DN27246_c0_g1_i1.p1  ORF type:complete len:279 (-),score=27.02 TRINITY_DN27246_c0_g1_i1:544-1380(-)
MGDLAGETIQNFDDLFPYAGCDGFNLNSFESTDCSGSADSLFALEDLFANFPHCEDLFPITKESSSHEFVSVPDVDKNDNQIIDTEESREKASQKEDPGVSNIDPHVVESKRQLRLMKNREAASLSRQRKKSYIEGLESKCRMWERYCNTLQRSIAFMSAENMTLRNELLKCKRQRDGKGVMEPAVPKDSLQLESPSQLTLLLAFYLLIGIYCLLSLPALINYPKLRKSGRQINGKGLKQNLDELGVLNLCFVETPALEAFPVQEFRAFSSWRRPLCV